MEQRIHTLALVLKSSNGPIDTNIWDTNCYSCIIDPNCPEDQKYIQQAQDLIYSPIQ